MTAFIWTGATAAYELSTNYSPSSGGPPGSADTATFDASGITKDITIASGPQTPGGWIFNGGTYNITVSINLFFEGAGIQVNGGSATVNVATGGDVTFQHGSSGGAAAFNLASGTDLNFSGATGNATAGSIAGAGQVDLADNQQLTEGSNNFSTVFSGNIFGGPGTSLVKTGSGTLILSGNNVLPGGITFLNGGLELASIGAVGGSGGISFGTTPATLQIDNAALGFGGHFFAPVIFPFNSTNSGLLVVDVSGLPFSPFTSVIYDKTHSTLAVDNGTKGVTFDHWHPQEGYLAAVLDDHNGGTNIVSATIESRPNKHVDAKHHPPGQLSPTNGANVIVLNGPNDTGKGGGGADTMVGGAPGDVLIASSTTDIFAFLKIKASPPGHPDTITHFIHPESSGHAVSATHAQGANPAQGDKIDLYDLHFFVPGQHHLVFIGAQTFAQYHHHHPTVFGMVRDAGGVVEVNVNHRLANEFEIKVPGVHLHLGDFIL